MTDDENSLVPDGSEIDKPRGRPFEPGQSGNPRGRPKGSRNKATLAMEALLEGDSEIIIRKLIEKAKEGDATALRLCLDRLMPPRRDRLVELDLPAIDTAADASKASAAVLAACADGMLSPAEAHELMALITAHVRVIETCDLEARLTAVEKSLEEELPS